jgi:archaellum biogenesis ATPase FlaH
MAQSDNKFSPFLLKSILNLLFTDSDYRDKFFPILTSDHFNVDDKMVYTIAKTVWGMYEQYSVFPSVDAIADEIFHQKGRNIGLFPTEPSKEELLALATFFDNIINEDVTDKKYVEDNTTRILSFLAVLKVVVSNKDAFAKNTLDVDEFTKDIISANTFATPIELGVNLFGNLDKRTDERASSEITPGLIEYNIPPFAKYLEEGGLPPGSLGFFLAPTNGGKSSALIQLSHDAALKGHHVLYVSAELSEDMIKRRFDACMTGIPIHNIKKEAGSVRAAILSSPQYIATAQRIQVVEVPMGVAKPSDIEILIDRLKKRGIETNLLVIDYADNLRSQRKSEQYRLELTSIYKDLRAIAQRQHLVVWTASQMNDAGTEAAEKKSGVITIRHVNESRGKIQISDLCVGIARTQEEKETGLARLILVKNRNGAGDGSVVQVSTRFDLSRLFGEEKNVIPMSSIALDEGIEGFDLVNPDENGTGPVVKTYRLNEPSSLQTKYGDEV